MLRFEPMDGGISFPVCFLAFRVADYSARKLIVELCARYFLLQKTGEKTVFKSERFHSLE